MYIEHVECLSTKTNDVNETKEHPPSENLTSIDHANGHDGNPVTARFINEVPEHVGHVLLKQKPENNLVQAHSSEMSQSGLFRDCTIGSITIKNYYYSQINPFSRHRRPVIESDSEGD